MIEAVDMFIQVKRMPVICAQRFKRAIPAKDSSIIDRNHDFIGMRPTSIYIPECLFIHHRLPFYCCTTTIPSSLSATQPRSQARSLWKDDLAEPDSSRRTGGSLLSRAESPVARSDAQMPGPPPSFYYHSSPVAVL